MVSNKEKIDLWALPSTVIMWCAILWVAYNLYIAMTEKGQLIKSINKVTDSSVKDPQHAEDLLCKITTKRLALENSPGYHFLAAFGKSLPDTREQYGRVYQALGDMYDKRNEVELTVKNYSLCMLHTPLPENIAVNLGSCCIRGKNNELGYYVGILAEKNKPGSGKMYLKYFGKKGKPSWAENANK